jgi:type IX secretion system PorP/SprF family membrane protein
MRISTVFFILVLIWVCGESLAQVGRPQFSQYMTNYFILNPAVAGIDNDAEARISHRNQWSGFEGSPRTTYFSFHVPIGKTHHDNHLNTKHRNRKLYQRGNHNRFNEDVRHHGIGLVAMNDRSGAVGYSGLEFSYAYHQPLNNQWSISAGTSAAIGSYSLAQITTDQPNDPSAPKTATQVLAPNIHLGASVYSQDLLIGFSSTRMIDPKINFATSEVESSSFRMSDLALLIRYKYHLNKEYTLAPSILVKRIANTALSYDMSLKFVWAEKAWVGSTYRFRESLGFISGINLNAHIAIGYAYDYTFLPLQNNFAGSHEIILALRFHNDPRIISPQEMW